jgi:hypothetical protein
LSSAFCFSSLPLAYQSVDALHRTYLRAISLSQDLTLAAREYDTWKETRRSKIFTFAAGSTRDFLDSRALELKKKRESCERKLGDAIELLAHWPEELRKRELESLVEDARRYVGDAKDWLDAVRSKVAPPHVAPPPLPDADVDMESGEVSDGLASLKRRRFSHAEDSTLAPFHAQLKALETQLNALGSTQTLCPPHTPSELIQLVERAISARAEVEEGQCELEKSTRGSERLKRLEEECRIQGEQVRDEKVEVRALAARLNACEAIRETWEVKVRKLEERDKQASRASFRVFPFDGPNL